MTEKLISNFVESQFPAFYKEEGPNFILFMRAYYEWMEAEGNPVHEARTLTEYRDIDSTIEDFLEHFQKKYLYGIPFNVIINKRFLLKHILDVYRSKGTIQCYKLLFKLLYNQDVEVYLPGVDILKASHGTWVEPRYLEVTETPNLNDYVGKVVEGISSGTKAVIESFVKEPINQNIISTLYISNILPRGGEFIQGEKIVIEGETDAASVAAAPTIIGSLGTVEIMNGGQGFNVGDVLKIVHRDPSNNSIVSFGVDGELRVTKISRGQGAITFDIASAGFGYTTAPVIDIYNASSDVTGANASFLIGSIGQTQDITYNTDLIVDRYTQALNSTTFGFAANASANVSTNIGSTLAFTTKTLGSLTSLTSIQTGSSYTQSPKVFVREPVRSANLAGTITYTTGANTITGVGTAFDSIFASNDAITIRANTSSTSDETHIIYQVTNSTSMILYGKPKYASTGAATYRAAPAIMPAQFAVYESSMQRSDSTINGLNGTISALPSIGSSIVAEAVAINSGKGYVDGEVVQAYLYAALAVPTVLAGGTGYANGDALVFAGGGTPTVATGFVTTNTTGGIISSTLTYPGSGYTTVPVVNVKSKLGSGATLTTTIVQYNTFSQVQAKVVKSGVGKQRGYWTTTRGFLNSDKYIQDSFFYQDYSYQIKVASTLDKYKNILYNTFHPTGSEMFGQFQLINTEASNSVIAYEPTAAALS